jgi:5,5'-dehydrodivanillate O-demethylase
MLTREQNDLLTQVGPATGMGKLLRCYWMPVAGVSEFDSIQSKALKILGEDLVLYKDLSGHFGLVDRHCVHRRADLSAGMVEERGIRCHYHGWLFNANGDCLEQPYEDTAHPQANSKSRIKIKSYPTEVKGGLIWAYFGQAPSPQLPDWEAFSWKNGFVQVVISSVPCNWFQCQENSIDPVHFEWMHENWGNRLRTNKLEFGAKHLKVDFKEFEHGFTYHRIKEGSDEQDEAWQIGRVCLWPNGFFLGEHFEWRVPIDDENTLSVTWKYTRVPKEMEPFEQSVIPTWYGPVFDEKGQPINTHVMNQDFLAWMGQGTVADRTKEHIGASDKGIVMMRKRFFDELQNHADQKPLKAIILDASMNHHIQLPMVYGHQVTQSRSIQEIKEHKSLYPFYKSYVFQAGQPDWVKKMSSQALGIEVEDFDGVVIPRQT